MCIVKETTNEKTKHFKIYSFKHESDGSYGDGGRGGGGFYFFATSAGILE
jgi:hypothetical protein